MQNLQKRVAELGWAEEVPVYLDIEQVKHFNNMFEQAPLEYLAKVIRSQILGFESRKVKGAEFPILAHNPCMSFLCALKRRQPSVSEIQQLGLGKSIGAVRKYAPEVTLQHSAQAVINSWMSRWKDGAGSSAASSSSGSSHSGLQAGKVVASNSSSSSEVQAGQPKESPPVETAVASADPECAEPESKKRRSGYT